MKEMKFVVLILSFTIVLFYIFYLRNFGVQLQKIKSSKLELSAPLILSWNGFFEWKTTMEWLLENNDVSKCAHLCQYSADRTLYTFHCLIKKSYHFSEQQASIIIFHMRNDFDYPQKRLPNQLYTFFLLESPVHSGEMYKKVPRHFFNISMSYRPDSDIFYPYDCFEELAKEADQHSGADHWTEEEVNWKVGIKSKLALQFVSNCHTNSRREDYVKELAQNIELSQMGKCSDQTGCHGECELKMIDEHFFYLAFENSVCQSYVSEKFWNVKKLIVPVVLSRGVLANLSIPADAFIAADDFASPRELAAHLKMVASDRKLYMRHLQWTKKYKSSGHNKGSENALCQLCAMAHGKLKRRRIEDIVDFWEGDNGKCQPAFAQISNNAGKIFFRIFIFLTNLLPFFVQIL